MVSTHSNKNAIWLQRFFLGIWLVQQDVRVYFDSNSTSFLEKNPYYHFNEKNIDVHYHFLRNIIEDNGVLLEKEDILNNDTDS